MVRVDKDLKRCYFYRVKVDGDVKKSVELRDLSPEFPKSGEPRHDIIPYNPHFRQRASRQASRPASQRRISWSREADRVREISPRSEPDKIFYPPPVRRTYSGDVVAPEEKYPLEEKKRKKKKKSSASPKPSKPKIVAPPTPEPIFEPVQIYTLPKAIDKKKVAPMRTSKKDQLIRQQRDKRYQTQKAEQNVRRPVAASNLRKIKSESNLRTIPKEPLMKKAEAGKSKHFNPPRWRHVGDRSRRHASDKNARSFASDYYF